MSARAQQLQAMWARRREIEHDRRERVQAVDRYYDHWGKVTSRFESWTGPEYYEAAKKRLELAQEKKDHAKKLELRREALRKLLMVEREQYDRERQEKERPRSRKIAASNELLKKIAQKQKEEEQMKEKLTLEAKLYGKWRHGVEDENLIFDSKSDNEVMAKLNWLDTKIQEQKAREKEEALAQERELRIKEEQRRLEEEKKERQRIREQEIVEMRALQERHMEELKQRQAEGEDLKHREEYLRRIQNELKQEIDLVDETAAMLEKVAAKAEEFSSKKIKIHVRNRSEIYRSHIKIIQSILERVRPYAQDEGKIKDLIEKYKEQLSAENYTMTQIEAMYESEVKYALPRCEEVWQTNARERSKEVKAFLQYELDIVDDVLLSNLQRQKELVEIRATHLKAIETSNDKLKQLFKEEDEYLQSLRDNGCATNDSTAVASNPTETDSAPAVPPSILPSANHARPMSSNASLGVSAATGGSAAAGGSAGTASGLAASSTGLAASSTAFSGAQSKQNVAPKASESYLPQVTNSFKNLNLDVWGNLPSARGGIDTSDLKDQRSLRVVTSDNAVPPKFGRKRVVWT